MEKPVKLRVRPNPYFELDAYGMPAGLVRVDPSVGRPGTIEFVGAKVTKRDIDTKENKAREPLFRRRELVIAYAKGAVEIVKTDLHVQAVRSGALLADDKETARACGIWFVEPEAALKQAQAKAIADWRASHGENPPVGEWSGAVDPPNPDAPAVAAPAEEPLASPFLTPEMLAEQSAKPAPKAAKQAAPAAEVK